jgi:redox-sensitive bicupin YhaK (pirin superfamily)
MLRYLDSKKMGRSRLGWLDSHFHFSFAEYYNPDNINFGVLRVVNDDRVAPGTGFDLHSHQNMEILSYVVEGELTHADSMGNRQTLSRGQMQYMSAGLGVTHSEHNYGRQELRFLQIWILPDRAGHQPNYGDCRFAWPERENRWLPLAGRAGDRQSLAPIAVHADINAYAASLEAGKSLDFKVEPKRQAYLILIEGRAEVNAIRLLARDALEIVEENIRLQAVEGAHALIIEMAKGEGQN